MIYDHISNIERYKTLSKDIYEGLKFIAEADENLKSGTYQISENVRVGVSEYTTKPINENGYETHDKFIDIQFLLAGNERILCRRREILTEKVPYNAEKDCTFYYQNDENCTNLILADGYFVIFFPNDAHAPQLCLDVPENVKKIVVKVKI